MTFHDQKLEKIVALLELRPYWRSKDLAKKLGISKSTIQKCLQELHDANLAERIHGGIRRINLQPASPIALDKRIAEDAKAKEQIAAAAVKLLPKSGYVYLDAGTTMLPLAQLIANKGGRNLTFITNDVSIASVLAKREVKHILLGGSLHPVTQSLSGPLSQSQIGIYNFNTCFISANGVSADGTVTCSLMGEAMLKQQAIKQSANKVLLAASGKYNDKAPTVIAKLKEFDMWICEKPLAGIKNLCRKNKIKLQAGTKQI